MPKFPSHSALKVNKRAEASRVLALHEANPGLIPISHMVS